MLTVTLRRSSPESHRVMDVPEDALLLEKVARHRDRAAFEELYRRYEKRAFNLAYHLTGNAELARDAVQEAMLDLWRSSEPNRTTRNSGWIMRVVANKSISQCRKRNVERKHMSREWLDSERQTRCLEPAAPQSEREELLEAVRGLLDKLPDVDRQVIALRFGAELSQEEIGELCSLSQRTISAKLAGAMERLRMGLSQAGFAAALPLFGPSCLGEAVLSGQAAPATLREQILKGLAHVKRQSVRATAAGSGLKSVLGLAVCMALAAGAVVAGVLYWGQTQPPPPPTEPDAPKTEAPVPAEPPADMYRKWTFEKGPPDELEVIEGTWTWERKDRMVVRARPVRILLPELPWKDPFLIRFRGRLARMRWSGHVMCEWVTKEAYRGYRTHLLGEDVGVDMQLDIGAKLYFSGGYILTYLGDTLTGIQKYDQLDSKDRICLSMQSLQIWEVEIAHIDERDLPAAAADAQGTLSAWKTTNIEDVPARPLPKTNK